MKYPLFKDGEQVRIVASTINTTPTTKAIARRRLTGWYIEGSVMMIQVTDLHTFSMSKTRATGGLQQTT